MLIGLSCMAGGYFHEHFVPTQSVWTDQQAEELGQASARFHAASFGKDHSHEHGQPHAHQVNYRSDEYQTAKAAYDAQRGDLERSLERQTWIKYGMVLTGVLIAGWGVLRVAMGKLGEDDAPRRREKRPSRNR